MAQQLQPTKLDNNQGNQAPARKRRGFPVVPTLMVAIAVPILCGFGTWQYQRSQWKEALLADLARNSEAPVAALSVGELTDRDQFRLADMDIQCAGGSGHQRVGRNLKGQSGYSQLLECTSNDLPITVDAGWAMRPDKLDLPATHSRLTGRLVQDAKGGWILVSEQALGQLEPSAPPSFDTISNNHMSYAIQWFSFAAILALIYAIWLRRWLARDARDA